MKYLQISFFIVLATIFYKLANTENKRIPNEVRNKLLQGEKIRLYFIRERCGIHCPYIGYFFTDKRIIFKSESQQGYTIVPYNQIKNVDCSLMEEDGIIHFKFPVLSIELFNGVCFEIQFGKLEDAKSAKKIIMDKIL